MRFTVEVKTKPASLPVSMEEAKTYLKIDGDSLDMEVNLIIESAVEMIESLISKSLINRTYTMFMDQWPVAANPVLEEWWQGTREGPLSLSGGQHIDMPRPPLVSVTSIKTYDDSDSATTFNASNYFVDTFEDRIALRSGVAPPTTSRTANGIEIEFVAGYGPDMGDIPAPIRLSILKLSAHSFENRGDQGGSPSASMPKEIPSMLAPYREVIL